MNAEADTSWHEAFLLALEEDGCIARAARVVGVKRRGVYEHMATDKAFRAAVKVAKERAVDTLEGEAIRRARDGVTRLREVGDNVIPEQVYSDDLLKFLLKGLRPGVYGDRSTVTHAGEVSLAALLAKASTISDPDLEGTPPEAQGDAG